MATSPPGPEQPGWRQHLIALFVTFHIICIFLYALPRPPAVDDSVLEHPEVKAEMASWPEWMVRRYRDLLGLLRGYTNVTGKLQRQVEPYVDAVGSTQAWNMFGGTPPRLPKILVVEVRPEGESDFTLFQDLHWGTADSKAMNFRHRKVHENLIAWSDQVDSPGSWAAYAAYWARRWDQKYRDRPARAVRLSVLRLTTPSARQVRQGDSDRREEPVPGQRFVWEKP